LVFGRVPVHPSTIASARAEQFVKKFSHYRTAALPWRKIGGGPPGSIMVNYRFRKTERKRAP
jgi:hypothetical protein